MEIYHQFCPWRNPAKKYSTVSAANPLSHPERQKNIFAFPKSSWRQTSALLAEINEALFFRIRVYRRNGKQLSWKVLIQSDWFKKKKKENVPVKLKQRELMEGLVFLTQTLKFRVSVSQNWAFILKGAPHERIGFFLLRIFTLSANESFESPLIDSGSKSYDFKMHFCMKRSSSASPLKPPADFWQKEEN